jgi:hypothetical protein
MAITNVYTLEQLTHSRLQEAWAFAARERLAASVRPPRPPRPLYLGVALLRALWQRLKNRWVERQVFNPRAATPRPHHA